MAGKMIWSGHSSGARNVRQGGVSCRVPQCHSGAWDTPEKGD